MRPALRLGALVCAMCLVGSTHAEAGFWDWLEELNGPGPSTGRLPPLMANIFCDPSPSRGPTKRAFQITEQLDGRSTCIFVDLHGFHAEDDSRFYPVDSTILEFGTSVRLHPTTELGAGFGRLSFSSRNTDSDTSPEIEGGRWTVSFPRVVFKPLLAIPMEPFQSHAGWGFLSVYFKHTIIVGELTESDFASKEGTEFSRTNQRVESVGFLIDASALVSLFTSK